MISHPTCAECEAHLPPDSATCSECGSVACWDCGAPNATDQAFCRRCGVWLVGQEEASPREPRPVIRPKAGIVTAIPIARPITLTPLVAAPLRVEPPRRRARWAALTLVAVASLALVAASVVTLDTSRPAGVAPAIAAVLASPEPSAAGAASHPSSPPSGDTSDASVAGPAIEPLVAVAPIRATEPEGVEPEAPGIASGSVDDVLEAPAPTPRVSTTRSRSGWVCGDAMRVTDTRRGRWSVDRVSFRALGEYERVILHLDREGSGGSTATASGEAFAPAAARPASGRMTIGIELAGGIRSGLELRSYRPQGLRTIRELSISMGGPASRVLISVASDGCFRMRAPGWQAGGSSRAASAQLIVDVRR